MQRNGLLAIQPRYVTMAVQGQCIAHACVTVVGKHNNNKFNMVGYSTIIRMGDYGCLSTAEHSVMVVGEHNNTWNIWLVTIIMAI